MFVVPVFWMFLLVSPVGAIDDGLEETKLRDSFAPPSVSMTGKPIKIPPKKV